MSKESDRRISFIISRLLVFLFSVLILAPTVGGTSGIHHHHYYHGQPVNDVIVVTHSMQQT